MTTHQSVKYKRILLKLSGEALQGELGYGIDPKVLNYLAKEIGQLIVCGVQVGVVIGGGNLFRGAQLHAAGLDRVTGDHMGMLATVMNALALRDALERSGINTRLMSAIAMDGLVERHEHRKALRFLSCGDVIIFSAGTGNPYFTTDSAACLRGVEIEANLVIKATKVDGVYDKDPHRYQDAKKFTQLTYDQVLDLKLGVMDLTAICMMRDNKTPIVVFDMHKPNALINVVTGNPEGTLIDGGYDA